MAKAKTEPSTSSILMYNGKPFRGSQLTDITKDGPEPVLDADIHVRILDMSSSDDLRQYETICQHTQQQTTAVLQEDRRYIDSDKKFIVFIKWADLFYRMPAPHEIDR